MAETKSLRQSQLIKEVSTKQDELVSGDNIKTINGVSILGTGNITTSGGISSVSGTAPVVSSGGSTPVISMSAASSGVDGYMTGAYATKLDGIAVGANNYVLPTSVVHDNESGALHATDALRVSGTTLSLYKGDGSFESVTTQDTVYTHPTTDGSLHVPATGTTSNGKVLTAGSTAGSMTWETPTTGVTDHGALTGLSDDDHTQYINNTRGDARYAQLSHTHGDISNTGTISSVAVTATNTDYLLISDTSNSGKIQRGVAIGSGTTTFLRNDGTWGTPTGTTYSLATASVLGLIKLGSDTVQSTAPNAVTTTASRSYAIQANASGQMVVNVPWTDTVYTHPTTDGNLHVPATGTTNSGKVLTAGATAGSMTWETPTTGTTTLDGLTDVTITTPSSGQVLKYNGSTWINDTDATGGGSSTLTIQNKAAAYTIVAGDLGTIINCTSGTFTVSLTAAATLGAGFNCLIWNTSATATDTITIDPNLSETIDGVATIILRRGEGCQIVCDGTNWQLGSQKEIRGYAENQTPSLARPTASGAVSYALGYGAQATNTYSVSFGIGGISSGSGSSVFGGFSNTASSNYSSAIGANSVGSGSQAVTGAGAMSLGGSYASGTDSFAAAIANNTSTYGATGTYSVAMGQSAKSTGTNSIAIGRQTVASGQNSIALIGRADIGFGNIASGVNSVAIGDGASAVIDGKYAFCYGALGVAGDSQYGLIVLKRTSVDATPVVLSSSGVAPSSSNQVILQNNSAYTFTGTVISKQSGSTNVASWKIEGVIVRGTTAGSTTLVASTVTAISNVPGWTLALSADTTNGGLAVTFTGAVATNIRTVATIETTEVIYA